MIKNLFKFNYYLRSLFVCVLFVFNTSVYSATPMPGMPNMSEADMSKFMGELENTAKELGYARLFCFTDHPKLGDYYMDLGYLPTMKNVTTFTKELKCHQ